jgi:hypothetical protein
MFLSAMTKDVNVALPADYALFLVRPKQLPWWQLSERKEGFIASESKFEST